jgi:hypothetical protein
MVPRHARDGLGGAGRVTVPTSDAVGLSASAQIALAVLAVLGVVLTAASLVLTIRWSPRKSNEHPRRGRPLRQIRFWRPLQYALALGYLQDYSERLRSGQYYGGDQRGRVTDSDLTRWIIQIALTCAAQIVPQSLGKANLFRVSDIFYDDEGRSTKVRVYSSEFVGVFSSNQMIDPMNKTFLRNLHFEPSVQSSENYPAALQCLGEGIPIIQALKGRRAAFDEPEKALGATHILAIPLLSSLQSIEQRDQAVSITVDLRYGKVRAWLLEHRDIQKTSIYRRAEQLSRALGDVLQRTQIVVIEIPEVSQEDSSDLPAPRG